jgi:hypothetical protein
MYFAHDRVFYTQFKIKRSIQSTLSRMKLPLKMLFTKETCKSVGFNNITSQSLYALSKIVCFKTSVKINTHAYINY